MLHADDLGSLQIGSPVYFREIKVGEVVAYELDKSGQSVDIQVFVRAPHHERVRANTRFWNASGLDVSLNAGGLAINTQSLVSLMIGGIAFATPTTLTPGPLAKGNTVFRLYSSHQNAFEEAYTRVSQWLLRFTGSARGLAAGAPVEFKGIQIGKVLDVKVEFDLNEVTAYISVLIELEPERLVLIGAPADSQGKDDERIRKQIMDRLVARGLRGQLKTGSLLTGALFVDLDIFPNAPPQPIVWQDRYPELPTVPTPLEKLENALAKALEKFKQLPLEQMGSDLQQSLAALRKTAVQLEQLLAELNTTAAPALSATLKQMQETLRTAAQTLLTANQTLAPDSTLQQEAQRVLRELTAAARSIRTMADYLERHPDALLRGKR
jgi:paraquat-inducible protein B